MMAKMFYTLEEAKAALGKNEEEIKQLAREGRLREFRDGPRLMFKADQVESLKSDGGAGGIPDIGVSDTGAPIGMAESRGGSGISLADTGGSGLVGSGLGSGVGSGIGSGIGSGMGSGLGSGIGSGIGSGGISMKDDTGLAADLGLSGSIGGVPSPGRPGSSGLSSGGSRGGINVLGESGADPMAQTAIGGGINDQINLEGVGSGSGLLDLTRESDDTSLGAELLDEIQPGGSGSPVRSRGISPSEGTKAGTSAGTAVGMSAVGRRGIGTPIYVESADPLAAAFGFAALGAAIFVVIGGIVLTSAILGTRPPIVEFLAEQKSFIVAAMGLGLALVLFIVGLVVGKTAR